MSLVASGLFQLMYAKRRFHKIQGSKRLLEPLYKPFWAGPDFKMADRIQKLVKHPHQERVFPEYGHLSCQHPFPTFTFQHNDPPAKTRNPIDSVLKSVPLFKQIVRKSKEFLVK